jgi:N-acetylmuramoyl-L-alanine amidase
MLPRGGLPRVQPRKISSRRRGLRWAAVLLAVLPGLPAHARIRHNESWAKDRFAAAERMREALNGRPVAERSRRDYQRVLNAYRNVYLGAPASAKADPSVVAVAETLVEMGRRFDDDKILKGAISQYRFLRREYPGSRYRFDALFTIGEIYKDDLDNADQARATFQDFIHRYPHNRLSADAQQAIADLNRPTSATRTEAKSDKNKSDKSKVGKSGIGANQPGANQIGENQRGEKKLDGKSAVTKSTGDIAQPERRNVGTKTDDEDQNKDSHGTSSDSRVARSEEAAVDATPAKLPRLTRIRHWSTPDYTRVAVDLEGEIKFGSKRIAHPDRIFFDLRDTKLASTLVGKSFDVDDGFLKKIRVSQYQPGRTRLVLEIADLSEYDAFLIPNPYRLIIDIHGKDGPSAKAREKQAEDLAKAEDVEAQPKPGSELLPYGAVGPTAEPSAEIGKAPITGMDVGGRTEIVAKDGSGAKSSTATVKNPAPAKTSAPLMKKIVEADDEDTVSAAGASEDVKSSENSDEDLAAAKVKISANSHTVVSRSRHQSAAQPAGQKPETTAELDVREAQPTARGDRSLIRALGLKIGKIVIDPGHGGHDTGTIGPNGLEEKDLVLEVGKRLGKLLETRLGAEVVYTRKDDTFIPLETRTAIANQDRADLFISIHANSSHDSAARGVETYYLNFTSSPEALEVAARENAVSEKSIYELQDLVKKIAMKEKIEESREFAGDVQQSLHSGLAVKSPAIRDRGVKKAPFIVLIGANMPSILAEISFVSNPSDERRLETSEYRQRIAESLYRGVARYVNGLSGVKVASKLDKTGGQ